MSLYLKYRPKDFDSLVGQNFIKNTLQKAVQENKVVGAYLFCGPRGTGKTSSARILAKSLNCENLKNGNPCNNCEICIQINEEKLIDIIEIDAASHTGVDNIREIIEKTKFFPTKAKYKIYIIDEVHMLSKGAFNALLKILEEPEKHVKFILATTETHKVPETIISRCQRYDFKNINLQDIKDRLLFISKAEGVTIDNDSLEYIAKNSSGGLRNAINLFEQLIVDNEINFENIISNLGIVKEESLENFLEKLINKDKKIIKDFEELIDSGKNIKLFFKQLIFFTKEKTVNLLLKKENINEILEILDSLNKIYSETKNSLDESTTFLIGILKIISNGNSFEIEKKEEIERTQKYVKEEIKEEEKEEIKEEEINSIDELNDIFGNNKKDKDENFSFDKQNFIDELKKSGAKPGLTMSIRGANITMNEKNLNIKFKTTFALNQAKKTENNGAINKAIKNIGLGQIKVNFI